MARKREAAAFVAEHSLLPPSLIKRGLQSTFGAPNNLQRMGNMRNFYEKKLKRYKESYSRIKAVVRHKQDLSVLQETLGREIKYLREEIRRQKEEIRNFRIDHFRAEDVEEAFRKTFEKRK